MDVFLRSAALVILSLFNTSVLASPPVDLTDFDGKRNESKKAALKGGKKDPGISERQMIYVDNSEGVENIPELRVLKYNVIGRDRPGREGKAMLRLTAEQRVKWLRDSKDTRWTLVEIPNLNKKTWVPKAALVNPAAN